MGMTIEDCISKLIEILEEATEDENAVCYVTDIDEPTLKMAIDTMRKYQKLQADYENRLKADMVAMLTDMLIDVEEIASREQWCDYANDNCISRYDVEDLFQQKINSLKEA